MFISTCICATVFCSDWVTLLLKPTNLCFKQKQSNILLVTNHIYVSLAELSWAVLVLYLGPKEMKCMWATCIKLELTRSSYEVQKLVWRSLNLCQTVFRIQQSAHLRAFFHGLSFKLVLFGVTFPKLCNCKCNPRVSHLPALGMRFLQLLQSN